MFSKGKSTIFTNIKNLIVENIIKYFKEYFLVTIIFIVGIIIGVVFINNLSENQSNEISTYINSFLGTLEDNNNVNYTELLKDSVTQNLILVVALWFVGATLIGIPLVFAIVLFRGFCLGYTISAVIHVLGISKGIVFVLTSMLLQNLIFIPAIIALAVSGIRLYHTVVKDRNSESIKVAILRHSIFSIIILVLLIISSVIEVFCSTNLFVLCRNFIVI